MLGLNREPSGCAGDRVEPAGNALSLGVFQRRPRSKQAEESQAESWLSTIVGTYRDVARAPTGVFDSGLHRGIAEAFPEGAEEKTMCFWDGAGPERGLAETPPDFINDVTRPSERVWRHTIFVLHRLPPRLWPAAHQVVRMMLQAVDGSLFP